MKKTTSPRYASLLLATVAVLWHAGATAGDTTAKIATTIYMPDALVWDSKGQGPVTLRVIGPSGYVHEEDFGTATPVFDLRSMPQVHDGQYKFELVYGSKVPANPAADRGERAGLDRAADAQRVVVSGAFLVQAGKIVPGDKVEPSARQGGKGAKATPVPKYFTHPEDVSVQGSLCVGLDCTSAESFGFSTIRLKENNTRIEFADTSVDPFPSNAWTLVANDNASGGLSRFSIEDTTGAKVPFTVEAGAATGTVYVDSTGSVGFGTTTPVLKMHQRRSDTPALRLEQDNSGGFTAQTWDVAGNEAGFFVRDTTGGSLLSFRILPGAPSGTLVAAPNGVGVGSLSPRIGADANRALTVKASTGFSSVELQGNQASNAATGALRFYNNNAFNAQIAAAREGAENTASLRFLTANAGTISENMRIVPAGDIGIGTSTPNVGAAARALTVAAPTSAGFAALELQGSQNADAASAALRFYNKTNLTGQIAAAREGADSSGSMRFLTANSGAIGERMRITPLGRVGIGTTAPATTLHVQGDVTITGALAVSGPCCGPDYVFDPAFRLASIEEQWKYMWTNRHLPAVGPARTTPDGKAVVDVFAQGKGILEELEKAHIYIGQLHREMESLKSEMAAREARLEAQMRELRRTLEK
jgi:hypothetical protein